MHDILFEEALDLIQEKDPRYQREAYHFVREALDHTQVTLRKTGQDPIRHVSGQQLLLGIRDFALSRFGPMTMMVLEEWGIRCCRDFGEVVFNMVESSGAPIFSVGDFKELSAFMSRLKAQADPLSQYIWGRLSEATRQAALVKKKAKLFEPVLVRDLNEIIRNSCLYDEERFAGVALSDEARALVALNLRGARLAQLNRLLLEEAYPVEIVKSHSLLAKTEQDNRADFASGYDFYEAFRKPFLPPSKQEAADKALLSSPASN